MAGNTKFQQYESQRNKALLRKYEAIRMKGGCCMLCGYNKNITALEFHHRDPTQKEAKLSGRELANNKWANILSELEKCDLLCSNCHSEVHHPEEEFGLLLIDMGGAGI